MAEQSDAREAWVAALEAEAAKHDVSCAVELLHGSLVHVMLPGIDTQVSCYAIEPAALVERSLAIEPPPILPPPPPPPT